MFSAGFDADVVRRLEQTRRGHIRHASYARPILGAMLTYDFPRIRVYCDGLTQESATESAWVFAFNLPIYASRLAIAPDADPYDGLIDVCEFRGNSLWGGLVDFGSVMAGRHGQWGRCRQRRVSSFRVESSSMNVPYQIDGSLGGTLPVEVQLLRGRVGIVVPAEGSC